jgi:diacylglycerol kinase family enzyme
MFLCASMLGLPARLGRYREAIRRRRATWLRFGMAAVRAALRFRIRRMVLEVGGAPVPVRSPSVTITVNALDDRSGRLFGRSRLDGGTLAAYVVRRRLTGMIGEHRAASMTVRSSAAGMHVMNDGERMILAPPLRYEVRPGALMVMAPRRPSGP